VARWQALPDTMPPEVRHLVEQLRRLKDRTGLSLVELGERTPYSKSSWQRYLNGAKPPPRQAVQALGRVAGADPARLLALWELADRAWPRAEGEPGGLAARPEPVVPRGSGHRRWRAAALLAFAVIVVLVVGLVWALPAGAG